SVLSSTSHFRAGNESIPSLRSTRVLLAKPLGVRAEWHPACAGTQASARAHARVTREEGRGSTRVRVVRGVPGGTRRFGPGKSCSHRPLMRMDYLGCATA